MDFNIKISFCLVFCILVRDCYTHSEQHQKILLLQSNLIYHKQLNSRLLTSTHVDSIGRPVSNRDIFTIHHVSSPDVTTVMKFLITNKLVISLCVSDFYTFNLRTLLANDLFYAGDVDRYTSIETVCQGSDINGSCISTTTERLKYIKLVSGTVLAMYPDIFDTVAKLNFKSHEVANYKINVTICGELKTALPSYYYEEFNIKNNCETDNKLAIIVLKSEDMMDVPATHTTVVFCEFPMLQNFKHIFPNSISLSESWKMEHAHLYLLKKMKWTRVAIVSDFDQFSLSFEKELSDMFLENSVSHIIERCGGLDCDFDETLKMINESQSKIIIANVGEANIDNLNDNIKKYSLTINNEIVWITRDSVRFETEVISLKVTPRLDPDTNTCHMEDKWVSKVLDGIKDVISQKNDTPYQLTNRIIASQLEEYLKEKTFVVITRRLADEQEIMDEIEINSDGEVKSLRKEGFKNPYSYIRDVDNCHVKGTRYYRPCNDEDIALIILIVTMFVISAAGIVGFFSLHDDTIIRREIARRQIIRREIARRQIVRREIV